MTPVGLAAFHGGTTWRHSEHPPTWPETHAKTVKKGEIFGK
jgi:hypothetical protein